MSYEAALWYFQTEPLSAAALLASEFLFLIVLNVFLNVFICLYGQASLLDCLDLLLGRVIVIYSAIIHSSVLFYLESQIRQMIQYNKPYTKIKYVPRPTSLHKNRKHNIHKY